MKNVKPRVQTLVLLLRLFSFFNDTNTPIHFIFFSFCKTKKIKRLYERVFLKTAKADCTFLLHTLLPMQVLQLCLLLLH